MRNEKLSTVPSLLSEELSYNVFMRTKEESVIKALKLEGKDMSASQILGILRETKNKF